MCENALRPMLDTRIGRINFFDARMVNALQGLAGMSKKKSRAQKMLAETYEKVIIEKLHYPKNTTEFCPYYPPLEKAECRPVYLTA